MNFEHKKFSISCFMVIALILFMPESTLVSLYINSNYLIFIFPALILLVSLLMHVKLKIALLASFISFMITGIIITFSSFGTLDCGPDPRNCSGSGLLIYSIRIELAVAFLISMMILKVTIWPRNKNL